ncbi:hypothetical protein MIMGU_mgv1a011305mg [Erythranthe guttata]|uniref:Nucleoplasmin-like domain-containing protein n=1 Tax=Erythranthe guttata TaxID=4155 RepID=A0A022RDM6_ERYGU|nr:PREDICTED: histone deacetylase HDT2-like [Erythranthe guttata]EYU36980.1 hypothetical protein MIMGU_mgv1a011305mg [Erythranthe guttata]|eukprot:XP_012837982.1 PREDICTED: histone deacetylase HDT2-like [Erythranthe guttata]
MEFWGVEVKAGQTLKIHPEEGKLIHISQAALGEVKDVKGAKNVPLRLRIDLKNFIIGSLAAEDRTQLMFDLVFEKDFELSHDWKNGSVFFIGYIADDPTDGDEFSDEDDEEEEEHEHVHTGKCDHKPAEVKAKKEAPAKPVLTKLESDSDDDEIDSDDSDEEMAVLGEDDVSDLSGDDSEDGSSSEEEELPKGKQAKKRPAEPAQQIPAPAKKAKAATPDNKQGNKKGQNATPPSKAAAGKMPAGNNKSNEKSPKSAGQSANKSGKKNFPSGKAQVSHSKGKHGGK